MSDAQKNTQHRLKTATPENVPAARAREIVLTVLVALVVIAGGMWFGGKALNERTTNLAYYMINVKWNALEEVDGSHEWIVLGDSSGAHSLNPAVFDESMETRTFNFAIIANMLVVNDAWMLEEYIRLHGAPKKVLVVHTMDIWHRGYRSELLAKVPREFGYWQRFDAKLDLKDEHRSKVLKGMYLPLYTEHKSAAAMLRGKSVKDTWFGMDDQGFIPGRAHHKARHARDFERTIKTVSNPETRTFSKASKRGLRTLGRLSSEHDFEVVLVKGPIDVGIASDPNYISHQKAVGKLIRRVTSKYRNFHYIDTEYPLEPHQTETTVDHANPRGSIDYTRRVAAELKKRGL